MPKVLPEYLEHRKQQILDAAAACFVRRGFHQTTMQDICQESELSPGAVYRYFPSKEAIIEAMAEYRQRQNAERLEKAMSKGATLEVFDELIRLFFLEREAAEMMATCALMLETITEAPRNPQIREAQARINAGVRVGLANGVRESQARGEIDPTLDADAVARVMSAVYQGYITQLLVDPDIDVRAYGEVLRSLFGGRFWRQPVPIKTGTTSPAKFC
jgi:AcrR family transcriptional regulator